MVSSDFSRARLNRPLIGLSTYYGRGQYGVWDRDAAFLPTAYITAVTRAGGRVVLLPAEEPWSLAEVSELDGVILTGGDDVDPRLYGADPHEFTQVPNSRRDRFEVGLYEHARRAGIPVFAICRGAQIVNTAHGGTLHQHLPDLPGVLRHDSEVSDEFAEVAVTTLRGTAISAAIGAGVSVRCHHHQSIDCLGAGLVISAKAEDGTVEAFEDEAAGMVAVQWHPEETLDDLRLFSVLVEKALVRAQSRTAKRKEV